ncbi:ATP-grasp domain-containing protein [Rodentibacter genomosp. 2]|uniref:Carbamoyl phosphate synthase large subunit n=1 Tax=Rodentibacter genomosp. 2 TaxID=1908266 RepID=A0A1V3JI20_9PAST|nr:ATP-grasp domain-containing protein [Rodentibacter genomosp. 2]OOF56410.1 carbamoyl phosphate synthase large subunit [Rodentibacter genomosp. 2]
MNILITSAGQRVSLVQAFKTELTKIVENGKVLTVDLNPILAPACHVADSYFQVPRVTDRNYIDMLLQICLENQIKLIVPTIDTELLILSENIDRFKNHGIAISVSDVEFVKKCRDKRLTHDLFTEYGIDIPKQFERDNLQFPLFAKPYNGSLSKGIFVVKSAVDLTEENLNNPELLFMQYISPEEYDEYTVDCYYDKNSQLKCVVPRQRIFVRAGEINKGVTRKNNIVRIFSEKLARLPGARGCLTVQVFFHKTEAQVLGIEINPRFGGGYPLSYLARANYPQWLMKEYLFNETIPVFGDWEDNLLMLRYDAEVLVHYYEK